MFEPKLVTLTFEDYEKLLWFYNDYEEARKSSNHQDRQMNSFLNRFAEAIFKNGLVNEHDFRAIFFELLEHYPNLARKFSDRSHGIYRGGYAEGGIYL